MSDQKYDGMPILGVDLDGVCADFYGHMRTIAAEWMEKEISELPEDFTWGLREWIGDKDYDSLHRFAVTRRNLFRDAPLMKGARRYLRQLSDERFRIRLIFIRNRTSTPAHARSLINFCAPACVPIPPVLF
jgi:hypothetical protein